MKQFFIYVLSLIILLSTTSCAPSSAEAAPEPSTTYIENKGSDTIVNLALAWAERYQSEHQDIRISVTGGGSGTGIASLINGTVDIANASRQIKPEEIDEAKSNDVDPLEHIIARDAIAVIVHPDNPVSELTLQQISDIYSGKITNWMEVGGEIFLKPFCAWETASLKRFSRWTHCCFHPLRGLSSKCGRTRMPLGTMVWDMCQMI
jgi:phosphate transport system substrate-binding protein